MTPSLEVLSEGACCASWWGGAKTKRRKKESGKLEERRRKDKEYLRKGKGKKMVRYSEEQQFAHSIIKYLYETKMK